jgi:hypothetical protein
LSNSLLISDLLALCRALCKAEWLNDPANEAFKNLDIKAQEKAFKESGHWKSADKKVSFSFVWKAGLTARISRGLEAAIRQSSHGRGMYFCVPLDSAYNSLLQLAKLGENSHAI